MVYRPPARYKETSIDSSFSLPLQHFHYQIIHFISLLDFTNYVSLEAIRSAMDSNVSHSPSEDQVPTSSQPPTSGQALGIRRDPDPQRYPDRRLAMLIESLTPHEHQDPIIKKQLTDLWKEDCSKAVEKWDFRHQLAVGTQQPTILFSDPDTAIALIGQVWVAKDNKLTYAMDKTSFSVRMNDEDRAEILSWAKNRGTMGWMMMYISEFQYFVQMGFIKCEFPRELAKLDRRKEILTKRYR